MRRAAFFAMSLVACAASPPPAHEVEIVPLPAVTATAVKVPETRPQPRERADDPRDPRSSGTRSHDLLVAEAAALETLKDQTAMSSPERPQLLRRLADTYAELRKLGDAQASRRAIETYTRLLADYPADAHADEARYYLALEYEMARDLMNARKAYYELIKNVPTSKWIPYAYFAFGEMFFADAQSDPAKWGLAQQAYNETLKFTASPISAEAACRLVEVHRGEGDNVAAANALARLKRDFPGTAAAARCGGP
jgi:TolA-binding protein